MNRMSKMGDIPPLEVAGVNMGNYNPTYVSQMSQINPPGGLLFPY